jgi:hypothetical protein
MSPVEELQWPLVTFMGKPAAIGVNSQKETRIVEKRAKACGPFARWLLYIAYTRSKFIYKLIVNENDL